MLPITERLNRKIFIYFISIESILYPFWTEILLRYDFTTSTLKFSMNILIYSTRTFRRQEMIFGSKCKINWVNVFLPFVLFQSQLQMDYDGSMLISIERTRPIERARHECVLNSYWSIHFRLRCTYNPKSCTNFIFVSVDSRLLAHFIFCLLWALSNCTFIAFYAIYWFDHILFITRWNQS